MLGYFFFRIRSDPHNHFANWDIDIHEYYDMFQKHGTDMLKTWADALFFIAPSNGADHEKKLAEKLGLKIFTDISEVGDVG